MGQGMHGSQFRRASFPQHAWRRMTDDFENLSPTQGPCDWIRPVQSSNPGIGTDEMSLYMNKTTKGAIAAGAAALLLAGGAGTMAAWSDSEDLTGGSITSGTLTLTAGTDAPTWTVNGTQLSDTEVANFLVVPGDEVVYSGTFVIGATGNNLEAELTAAFDSDSVGGDAELLAQMPSTISGTVGATALPSDGAALAITDANDGDTVTVNVTFDFDFDPATNASQDQTIDLAGFAIDLTQV